MTYIDWDELKNATLKAERNVCFEDVLTVIEEGKILANIAHPQKSHYPNQHVFIIELANYAYVIPYVKDAEKIFLKTIYPSRRMTKKYIIERRKP